MVYTKNKYHGSFKKEGKLCLKEKVMHLLQCSQLKDRQA